jgi:cytochrome b subunit of formate dehydrogenase
MPRMNLNQRAQHGLLVLAFCVALATGLLLNRPLAAAGAMRFWHLLAGFGAFGTLVYHLLYLTVRGYVEGRTWAGFSLRLTGSDLRALIAGARHLFAGAPAPPEADEYRPSQKLLYWWTLLAVALLGVTGAGVVFWGRLGTLSLLPQLAAAHRGIGLLLLVTALWHLYGVLTGEGRWWPEWSWVTGTLDAAKAQGKVPGAWRRHLRRLEEIAAGGEATPEQRERARLTREKDEVQEELDNGNRLALEERYVEALFHYRRALELYPGYSQARYNMARVLARMGERAMAREAYQQFLAADPFHPLARKAQDAIRELDAEDGAP